MSGTETMGQMYTRLIYDKDMNNLLNKYLAGYPLHSPAIEMAENELYNMGMSNMINPKYHPELNAKGVLGKPASSIMKSGIRGAAHLMPIIGAGLTVADIMQGLNQPVSADENSNIRAIYQNNDLTKPIYYNKLTGKLVD